VDPNILLTPIFAIKPRLDWHSGSAFLLFCLSVGGMIAAGEPRPTGEDLFWLGPAIGLLKSGQLINPYTQTWIADFWTSYFYVQGPVYFYVLAGWFHLCGVSTASIIVSHWLFTIVAAAGLVLLLHRVMVPADVAFLSAILFIFCFGKALRPEPLASALAFGALLLWDPTSASWKTFLSVFLMGLSILTYPVAIAFIPPFLFILSLNKGVPAWQNWKEHVLVCLAAGLTVIAVLAVMVQGHVAQFLQVLLTHRNLRATGLSGALPKFLTSITDYYEWLLTAPCFLLGGLVLVCTYFFRWIDPQVRRVVVCCSVAIFFHILLYPEGARTMGQVFALAAVLMFCQSVFRKRLRFITVALGVLMISQLQFMLLISLLNQSPPALANIESVRDRLGSTRKKICLDGAVARYVFDYRLPPNTTSFFYGTGSRDESRKPFAPCVHDVRWKNEDEVWAASQAVFVISDGSDSIRGLPPEYYRYEPVRFLGRSFNSIPKQPFKMLVFE
jgi:hypothetical protein